MLTKLLIILILFSSLGLSQQKYLVTPDQEFIKLDKRGATAAKRIAAQMAAERAQPKSYCDPRPYNFGYPLDLYAPNSNIGAYHKDVLGQWYIAKAAMRIDTIFWYSYNSVGAQDSLIRIRIYNSRIGPDYGPGVRDYAHGVNFPPPCQQWGYWLDSNETDGGITAFPEEATDTNWVSTLGGPYESTQSPLLNNIWVPGGVAVPMHSQKVDYLALTNYDPPCSLAAGDRYFVTMQVVSDHHVVNDTRTEWYADGFRVTSTSDENYPARDWKFYTHDSGPSNCGGTPPSQVSKGWVARGGFENDSLNVTVYNWWFAVTYTQNLPPVIADLPNGTGLPHSTFSTEQQSVIVELADCDPTAPGDSGSIAAAWLEIWTAPTTAAGTVFTRMPDIPLNPIDLSRYQAYLPGQPAGTTIAYRVAAEDNKGLITHGVSHVYKIVSLRNQFYYVDTGYAPVWQNISGTGIPIDPSSFFLQPGAGSESAPLRTLSAKDDGTAGPFDLGGEFQYFGKAMRYAWIGINGAIALSASATDTQDVNSDGLYSTQWDLPALQREGRADVAGAGRMPHALISPMWADFILQDQYSTYGKIVHGFVPGDSCRFVAEWDSIGDFDQTNGAFQDLTTFRVIINRCDNSIEFQWSSIGTRNKDSVALVGMEGYADSAEMVSPNPPYLYVCNQTYPAALRPMNNRAMKFIPVSALTTNSGWNLLSYLGTTPIPAASAWFGHIGKIFTYQDRRIIIVDTVRPGAGYWVKFASPGNGYVPGPNVTSFTIPIQQGWNMIGSLPVAVPVTAVIPDINSETNSHFFGYRSGYTIASTLQPGQGYWIKVNLLNGATSGTLTVASGKK